MKESVNSREKGARGERAVAKLLKQYGFDARRGQQFSGGSESPDVVHNVEGYHIEVKNYGRNQFFTEQFNKWMDKARSECAAGQIAAVVWKWNRSAWWIATRLKDGRYATEPFADFLARKQAERIENERIAAQQGV